MIENLFVVIKKAFEELIEDVFVVIKDAFGELIEDVFVVPDISIPLSVIIEDVAELK